MITSTAKSMIEQLLEATDLVGAIPWQLVHEKKGISLFRAEASSSSGVSPSCAKKKDKVNSNSNAIPCNVHAVTKMAAKIEDVVDAMITTTTEDYVAMMKTLSSDFLDGAVLHNIIEQSEANPHRYVGIKWASFQNSSHFANDKDFVLLEYVDLVEDEQGQQIAFRVMQSIELPSRCYQEASKMLQAKEREAQQPAVEYTRDVIPLMGFMYQTTKRPGELRMTYTCNFDPNGDLPAWAANAAIQSHVEKCITGTLRYLESHTAGLDSFTLPQQVIPTR